MRLLISILCFVTGLLLGQQLSQGYTPPNKEIASWIDEATYAHQYYVDNPSALTPQLGDVAFHVKWVNRYNQIKAYYGMK